MLILNRSQGESFSHKPSCLSTHQMASDRLLLWYLQVQDLSRLHFVSPLHHSHIAGISHLLLSELCGVMKKYRTQNCKAITFLLKQASRFRDWSCFEALPLYHRIVICCSRYCSAFYSPSMCIFCFPGLSSALSSSNLRHESLLCYDLR